MSTNAKVFKRVRNEGELLNITKILQEDDIIYDPLSDLGFD
jgi:hypothetical protein